MAKVKSPNPSTETRKRRPALSPETREQQLIGYAMDLVEQRLLDGTASSQETTHFLKLGSTKYKREMEKLEEENKLLRAKTEQIERDKDYGKLVEDAIKAMRNYQGVGDPDEYDY